MSSSQPSVAERKKAEALYQDAMEAYNRWEVDEAVSYLEGALKIFPNNAPYHMSLAQILSRAGDFDRALRSLANYLRLMPDSEVAERIQQLFASGMDPIEEHLTEKMSASKMPIDMIGAAIQMWMEFRIALGEDPMAMPKPEAWSAALDYTVRKVNLHDAPLNQLASQYSVSAETVRKHNKTLVKRLDIMPCDYRYFTGDENPLDKLVEAAELLEKLESRFSAEA